MPMTDELSSAIDRHRRAVVTLSQALERYRKGGPGLAEEPEPEPQLVPATQAYELTSLEVTGIVVEHLVVSSANNDNILQLDDAAATQLTVLIAIDAEIAKQAALLTEIRDPQVPGGMLQTRPLTQPERAALGRRLSDTCGPLFKELRQETKADVPPEPPPGAVSTLGSPNVKEYFDAILGRAAADIVDTITSSLSFANQVLAVLANPTGSIDHWSRDALAHGLTALRRLLVGAWRQVLQKVSLLVGQNAIQVGAFIVKRFELLRNAARHGASWTLGNILQIKRISDEGQALVDQFPARAGAAIGACQKVQKHHLDWRRPVWGLNKALPACHLIPGVGVALEAVAAAALLIYSIWLAHDHLDSPVLASVRLPKTPGLLTEIKAAVGVELV